MAEDRDDNKLITPLLQDEGHSAMVADQNDTGTAINKGLDLGNTTTGAIVSSSSSSASCFRRLFRKKVVTIDNVGLLVQVLSFLAYVVGMTASFIVRTYEESCGDIRDFRIDVTLGLIALWFSLGIIHEYALLLGGAFYIRWGGWTCVMAPIFHLILSLTSIRRSIMQHRYMEGNISCHPTLITVHVLCFGCYIALMRYNILHLKQLRDVYLFEGCDVLLSKETVEGILREVITVLDLDSLILADDMKVNEIQGKKDFADLIEGISSHVTMFGKCGRKKMSPSQFRLLSRELMRDLKENAKMQDVEEGSRPRCHQTRQIPLSWFEVVVEIFRKWMCVPKQFALTFLTVTVLGSIIPLQSLYLGKVIDHSNDGDARGALIALAIWASLFPVDIGLYIFLGFAAAQLNAEAVRVCRKQVLEVVVSSGTAFSDFFQPGSIVDTFTSQMGRVEVVLINSTYTLLRCALQLIMSVAVAARLDPLISVLFLSMMPVMFSVDKITRIAQKSSEESSLLEAKLASMFMSLIDCLPMTRSCNVGSWMLDRFDAPLTEHFNARKRTMFWSNFVQVFYRACGFSYLVIVVAPWGFLCSSGIISTGDFTALVTMTIGMIEPLTNLGGFMRTASLYSGSMKMVHDVLKQGRLLQEEGGGGERALGILDTLGTGLEIRNLIFRYSDSSPDILKSINLSIQKGTYVAICGSSGSGKSTLLELMMMNRLPQSGTIEWDGLNIFKSSLTSFRNKVGVMFQKTMIIQGTIRDNISFGLDPKDADIERAASMAEIADAINTLPNGYDTVLGDGKVGLSGGQLQRICLARVLYRKPSVLLLDEATSALDPISEAAIIQTIIRLRDTEGLTIVSVTHHPVTTQEADKIIVLHKGKVAEEGTYEELKQMKTGYFKNMADVGE
ncbi:hypothetical protein ACHAWF_010531 [Thalassiosira exigua]